MKVRYDPRIGALVVPPGHAIYLGLVNILWKTDALLAEAVPERLTHVFALHPRNWKRTFQLTTGKDPAKIIAFNPEAIPMHPGTLVAEMVFAHKAMWTGHPQWAELYRKSLRPVEEAEVGKYMKPELLVPPGVTPS